MVAPPEGEEVRAESSGDGPVDAIFRAINAASGVTRALREFHIDAVTEGQDALGEVSVVVEVQGQTGSGQGVSTDIIEAAARAYVRALSVALAAPRRPQDAARAARARGTVISIPVAVPGSLRGCDRQGALPRRLVGDILRPRSPVRPSRSGGRLADTGRPCTNARILFRTIEIRRGVG